VHYGKGLAPAGPFFVRAELHAYPVVVTTTVRRAELSDAAELARVAAITFPLACPPSTTEQAKADFIANSLSERSFAGYLAERGRILLLAEVDGVSAGYTMLITGDPSDPDVSAVVTARPTIELSKVYVLPDQHGTGVAAALMDASLAAARETGAVSMWLGVNNHNVRANRFYEKSGFALVGHKKFRLGDVDEDDYVRERSI
jgi:ribosomal protein S18 acetylase RimI-like enzyme